MTTYPHTSALGRHYRVQLLTGTRCSWCSEESAD